MGEPWTLDRVINPQIGEHKGPTDIINGDKKTWSYAVPKVYTTLHYLIYSTTAAARCDRHHSASSQQSLTTVCDLSLPSLKRVTWLGCLKLRWAKNNHFLVHCALTTFLGLML